MLALGVRSADNSIESDHQWAEMGDDAFSSSVHDNSLSPSATPTPTWEYLTNFSLGKSKGKRRVPREACEPQTQNCEEDPDDDDDYEWEGWFTAVIFISVFGVVSVVKKVMSHGFSSLFGRVHPEVLPAAAHSNWSSLSAAQQAGVEALGYGPVSWQQKVVNRQAMLEQGTPQAALEFEGEAMAVYVQTEDGKRSATVWPAERVYVAMYREVPPQSGMKLLVLFGGEDVKEADTFEELSVEEGAVLTVRCVEDQGAFSKGWSALSPEEQDGARVLGFNAMSWTNNKDWADLSAFERDGAKELGYSEQTWDSNASIAVEGLDWRELTWQQQHGAMAIGYTQQIWDSN